MTDAEDIFFSGGTMFGYWLTAVIYMVLPVIAYFIMKAFGAARLLPVIAGAVMYFIAVKLCDLTVWIALFSAPFSVKQAAAVELVCIFEETARWLAMKYPLFNIKSPGAAVCYGIGHAGMECWMRGVGTFKLIGIGSRINSDGINSFISGKTPEKAEETLRELQRLADKGLITGIAGSLEIMTNFGFHIALSLLIFKKMYEPNFKKRWLLLAIGLHYALNCISWAVSFSGNRLITSIVGMITGVIIIALVWRIIDGRSVVDEILYPLNL